MKVIYKFKDTIASLKKDGSIKEKDPQLSFDF